MHGSWIFHEKKLAGIFEGTCKISRQLWLGLLTQILISKTIKKNFNLLNFSNIVSVQSMGRLRLMKIAKMICLRCDAQNESMAFKVTDTRQTIRTTDRGT